MQSKTKHNDIILTAGALYWASQTHTMHTNTYSFKSEKWTYYNLWAQFEKTHNMMIVEFAPMKSEPIGTS
jgi:hypothetical protein